MLHAIYSIMKNVYRPGYSFNNETYWVGCWNLNFNPWGSFSFADYAVWCFLPMHILALFLSVHEFINCAKSAVVALEWVLN